MGAGEAEAGCDEWWLRFVVFHPFRKERERDGAPGLLWLPGSAAHVPNPLITLSGYPWR